MSCRIERLDLAGPAGRLEAQWTIPAQPRAGAALVLHPHPQHGGSMHTKAVHATARALAAAGLPVLRFNFRGVGHSAGHHTGGPGELEDAHAALAWLSAHNPGGPFLVGGFSFGAWVGLSLESSGPALACLLAIAPPLGMYDFGFVAPTGVPILCVAGTRDPFCPEPDLDRFAADRPARVTLALLCGAEHLLTTHLPELESAVTRFAVRCLASASPP